jgi:hypothetical protein
MGHLNTKQLLRGTNTLRICKYFHSLAIDSYKRTEAAKECAPGQHDALSAIILAVISLESFMGELEDYLRMCIPHYGKATEARITMLVDILRSIEEGRGQLGLKFQIAKYILTGEPYNMGALPYQNFELLLLARNGLIHPKTFKVNIVAQESEIVGPAERFLKRMRALNILADIPGDDVIAPISTWIETKAAARWACNTSAEMVHSLFQPDDKSPLIWNLNSILATEFVKIQ